MHEDDLTIHSVIALVKRSIGVRGPLHSETRIEHDLRVTGDDGEALLLAAFHHFGIDYEDERWDFREVFGLRQNEYLFHSEGAGCILMLDLPAIWRFLRGRPRPPSVVTDLTVGQLHEALLRSRRLLSPPVRSPGF